VPVDPGVDHPPPPAVKSVVRAFPDYCKQVDLAAFFTAVAGR
jgi:hypothetical protein